MQLLLIKIGKAWSVIRREGIVRGGMRVFSAFRGLFKRVVPGDILFISNGVGDSARYRTANVAEELTERGFRTAVTIQDNPLLSSYADKFSIFVFHRTLYTPRIAAFVERLKKLNKEIIFETDDLVYDPSFLPFMDGYGGMNALERKLYEHGLGGELVADPYITSATTTTAFLADKLREKGKRVFVVKNKLSKQDVVWANEALHKQRTTDNKQQGEKIVRVGYLSGTPSHNKDFATITEALLALFERFPEMRLVLAGPLDTESKLAPYADRIERVAFVPRSEFFGVIASLDINLAPLEIGNPFCESKSELKWFEAGIMGVPTVAAATEPFRQAITDGVDGYVAATTEEWEEKLGRLIESLEERQEMGAQARQTVLRKYTTASADNEEYYEYLRSTIKRDDNVTI